MCVGLQMLNAAAAAADAMPDTCSNSVTAIATTAVVSAAPDLPHAESRPTVRDATTGAHAIPSALAAPMGGDEWLGGDTPPMLQFTTACNGLASEHQPAQPNDLPRPPFQPLTTTAADAPMGGDLIMPMAGDKRPDDDAPPVPHSTAARNDLTTERQPAQPGDPPRPPPQPLTTTAAGAPLGGDRVAPLGGDEWPDSNFSPTLQFTAVRACTATGPQPSQPTDPPRPPSQPFITTLATAPLGGDMAAPLGGDNWSGGDDPMGRQTPPPSPPPSPPPPTPPPPAPPIKVSLDHGAPVGSISAPLIRVRGYGWVRDRVTLALAPAPAFATTPLR
jgi:hypothetical protein